MIFFLGLLDFLAGLFTLLSINLNVLTDASMWLLIGVLIKGLWSVKSAGKAVPLMGLGFIDVSAGAFGLLFINYGLFYGVAYFLIFIILVKGFFTSFSALFR